MGRVPVLVASIACYFAFFASFLYLIGFVAAFEPLPTHVDKGLYAPSVVALVYDLILIALFGLQHSVMARPAFKARWTKTVPAPLERSIYCLTTALMLVLLFAFWHPLSGQLWSIGNPAVRTLIWVVFFMGWGILFVTTFLLNHFELFGLEQAWHHYRGTEAKPPVFRTPLFYKWVRHPLYSGFLLAFWATPDMTYSHLLLATGFTVYIFIGIAHEERDLVAYFGETYLDYRKKVGSVIPGIGKKA
ncbi:isoprenylcysteine carboxylmethyltransferase family protein [Altererythrobacter salegens]|uniref:methanethiol S-methyltransferase n=1 Tax=Croceibacterium salegens TaxID=1737568 RepID=A0A6I4STF5_9SPHN|nr:methanethiol S-methyltransferase [Croceibacterium salegens]MXO58307.1 isoprenylcysteine carboxylmethyltransferase family protein [Croceibacterium salegens]